MYNIQNLIISTNQKQDCMFHWVLVLLMILKKCWGLYKHHFSSFVKISLLVLENIKMWRKETDDEKDNSNRPPCLQVRELKMQIWIIKGQTSLYVSGRAHLFFIWQHLYIYYIISQTVLKYTAPKDKWNSIQKIKSDKI